MKVDEAFNAALRVMDGMGLTEAFGHLSVRMPENPGLVRITPAAAPGTGSYEGTICLDLDGNRKGGEESLKAPLETSMHLAIYKARPDVCAICRTHSPHAVIMGAAGEAVPCLHGFSLMLGRKVPLHRDIDLIYHGESGKAVAMTLGESMACLIRGNGALAVGPDIQHALVRAIYLEEACRIVSSLGLEKSAKAAAAITEQEYLARVRWHENEVARAWAYYSSKFK